MTSVSFIVLLVVIIGSNVAASDNSDESEGRGTPSEATTPAAPVQTAEKCEDHPECPAHIANGFCYRKGVTEEQRRTYCPLGCDLCNKTESLNE
ncbi:hypothetical protein V3C99_015003 [Haemonchus contortus]